MRVFIIIVAVIVVLCVLYYLFPLIQVCGDSMYPTYLDGQVIIGCRLFRRKKRKVGEVVIYRSPEENGRKIVIKRVAGVNVAFNQVTYYCLGDNSDHSYDSRYYGAISSENLVCRVLNQRRNCNVYNQERRNS